MNTRQGAVALQGGYSVLLTAPEAYWCATPAQIAKMCNGCGSKGLSAIVPGTMWGLDIEVACDIHDVAYTVGETVLDKEQADREFLNNLLRLIEKAPSGHWRFFGPVLTILRHRRALKYWEAVNYFGGPAFWSGKS